MFLSRPCARDSSRLGDRASRSASGYDHHCEDCCQLSHARIISREPASDSDQNIALSTHIGAAATNLERSGRLYETELSGARLSLGLEGIDL
jgi:hypothetical protein